MTGGVHKEKSGVETGKTGRGGSAVGTGTDAGETGFGRSVRVVAIGTRGVTSDSKQEESSVTGSAGRGVGGETTETGTSTVVTVSAVDGSQSVAAVGNAARPFQKETALARGAGAAAETVLARRLTG